jgi:hypothetical protein
MIFWPPSRYFSVKRKSDFDRQLAKAQGLSSCKTADLFTILSLLAKLLFGLRIKDFSYV